MKTSAVVIILGLVLYWSAGPSVGLWADESAPPSAAPPVLTTPPVPTTVPHYTVSIVVDPVAGTVDGQVMIDLGSTPSDRRWIRLMLNLAQTENPKVFPGLNQNGPESYLSSTTLAELRLDGRDYPIVSGQGSVPIRQNYNQDKVLVTLPNSDWRQLRLRFHDQLPRYKTLDDMVFVDLFLSRSAWLPVLLSDDEARQDSNPLFTISAQVKIAGAVAEAGTPRAVERWQLVRQGTNFRQTAAGEYSFAFDKPVSSVALAVVRDYRRIEAPLDAGASLKTLSVYCRSDSEDIGRIYASLGQEILADYARRYYGLDYAMVSLVQGPQFAGGLAADGLAVIGDGLWGAYNRLIPSLYYKVAHYILAHELGHFYFGLPNPPDYQAENYLSEGLNEVSTLDYFEGRYGQLDNLFPDSRDFFQQLYVWEQVRNGGHSQMAQKFLSVASAAEQGLDQPLAAAVATKLLPAARATDYDKSVYILRSLARLASPGSRLEFLKAYLKASRYSHGTTPLLRRVAEELAGRDFGGFFSDFVYGTKAWDYRLEGQINLEEGAGFKQRFEVRSLGASTIFVPTDITVYLADGSTMVVEVPSAGTYVLDTKVPVRYGVLDQGQAVLDRERKDNVFPRQLGVDSFKGEHQLIDFGLDKVGLTYLWPDPSGTLSGVTTGIEAYLTDLLHYRLRVDLLGTIDYSQPTLRALAKLGLGLNLNLGYDASLALSGLIDHTGYLPQAVIGFRKYLVADLDYGNLGHSHARLVGFQAQVGLYNYQIGSSASEFWGGWAQLSLDLVAKTGSYLAVDNETHYFPRTGATENKTRASLAQLIPFFRGAILGLGLDGSASFGKLTYLYGYNSVVGGFDPTALLGPYDVHGRLFLGAQMANHLEVSFANLGVLQSVNVAFFYQVGTAFFSPTTIFTTLNHYVGFELIGGFRGILDRETHLALFAAYNITPVAVQKAGVTSAYSWFFGLDASVFVDVVSSSLAY